jgi:hypothetical protein
LWSDAIPLPSQKNQARLLSTSYRNVRDVDVVKMFLHICGTQGVFFSRVGESETFLFRPCSAFWNPSPVFLILYDIIL